MKETPCALTRTIRTPRQQRTPPEAVFVSADELDAPVLVIAESDSR